MVRMKKMEPNLLSAGADYSFWPSRVVGVVGVGRVSSRCWPPSLWLS